MDLNATNITHLDNSELCDQQRNTVITPQVSAVVADDDAAFENEVIEPNNDNGTVGDEGEEMEMDREEDEEMPNPWNPVVLRTLMPFVGASGGLDALKELRLVSHAFNDAVLAMPHPTPVCLNFHTLYPRSTTPTKPIENVDPKLFRNVRFGGFPLTNYSPNLMNFCQVHGTHVQILELNTMWCDVRLVALVIDLHLPNVRRIEIAMSSDDKRDCESYAGEGFNFKIKRSLVSLKFSVRGYHQEDPKCPAQYEMAMALVKATPNLKQLQIDNSHSGHIFFDLRGHMYLKELLVDFGYQTPREDCLNSLFCLRNLLIEIEIFGWSKMVALAEQLWSKMKVKKMKLGLQHHRVSFRGADSWVETYSGFKKLLSKAEEDLDGINNVNGTIYLYI